ncbi:MAG: hypothetical protein IPQ18_13695, partial [Saprospiraceae bacterium]|nr:hypothetical protein [Saprospiraceae bacterium]
MALFLISAVIPFLLLLNMSEIFKNLLILIFVYFIPSLFFFLWYRKQLTINARSVNIAIIVFQILLVSVCFAQYISFSFFNNISLYNIWGEAQLYYQLRPFSRMKGFYLEPSYLGFVTLAVFWLKLSLDKKPQIFNVFITFFILFTAKSGFAFLGVSLLLFHWYFLNMNRYIKIITLCFIAISAKSLNNSDTFKDVTRLNEISTEKYTSGYVRNILPISIIAELWEENHLLGIKFGQAEHVIKRVILFDVREGEIN